MKTEIRLGYSYGGKQLNRCYPRMSSKEFKFKDEKSLLDYFTKRGFTKSNYGNLYKLVDNNLTYKNGYNEVVTLIRREIVEYWRCATGVYYCRVGRKFDITGIQEDTRYEGGSDNCNDCVTSKMMLF